MYHSVTSVKSIGNYNLEIEFDSSEIMVIDFTPYLVIGRFRELLDYELFNSVRINFDTLEWNNGLDIDPEFLYEKSTKFD